MGVAIGRKGRLTRWLSDTRVSVMRAQLDAVTEQAEHAMGRERGYEWRLKGIRLPKTGNESNYWRGVCEGWTRADTLLRERSN